MLTSRTIAGKDKLDLSADTKACDGEDRRISLIEMTEQDLHQLAHRGSVSERNIASSRRVSIVDPVERNRKSRGDFLQTPLLPRIKQEVVPKSSRTAKVPPFVQLESLFAGDVFVSKYLTMFENYYQIHEEDNYLIEHYILTLMGLCYEYHL